MGLFSFFKGLFTKDIVFKGDKKSHLVYVYKPKRGKVWFDKNISVPENMEFYFAKKGNVLDGFISGEHELSAMYLSKTIKALKLNKKTRKGKDISFFVADGYYISMLQAEAKPWSLFAKVELFDEEYGYFKVMLEGQYIAKVSNPKQFLKKLLIIYDFLKPGEAEEILEGLISETVFKSIMKADANMAFLQDKDRLTDFLFEKITKSFEKGGVEILGFSVDKITFSKKIKKLINLKENSKKTEIELNAKIDLLNQNVTELKKEKIRNETEKIEIEKNEDFDVKRLEIKKEKTDKKSLFLHKGLFAPKTEILQDLSVSDNKKEISVLSQTKTSLSDDEILLDKIDKPSAEEYTKLSQNAKAQDEQVKCLVCGESNLKNNKNCILCGEKL